MIDLISSALFCASDGSLVRRLTSPVMKMSGSTRSAGMFSERRDDFRRRRALRDGDAFVHVRRLQRQMLGFFDDESPRFTSRGTTTRAAIDSSGKLEGMLLWPSSGTMGSIAGTSVRSSSVVGRRRVSGHPTAGGLEPSGTRNLGIICLFSARRQTLTVGRARRVPGCLP